jgi:hypothetical protein
MPGWQSAGLAQLHDPLWQVADGPLPHCALDVHDPQTPATHAWPLLQSAFLVHAGVQMPEAQASPEAQSPLTEHVQW